MHVKYEERSVEWCVGSLSVLSVLFPLLNIRLNNKLGQLIARLHAKISPYIVILMCMIQWTECKTRFATLVSQSWNMLEWQMCEFIYFFCRWTSSWAVSWIGLVYWYGKTFSQHTWTLWSHSNSQKLSRTRIESDQCQSIFNIISCL